MVNGYSVPICDCPNCPCGWPVDTQGDVCPGCQAGTRCDDLNEANWRRESDEAAGL